MKVKVIQKSMICLFNGENSVFPPFHPPVRPHLPPSLHPYFPPSLCRSFLLSGYTLFFPFLSPTLVRSSFPSSVSHSVSASAVPVTAPPSPCSVLPFPSPPSIDPFLIYLSISPLTLSFLSTFYPSSLPSIFVYLLIQLWICFICSFREIKDPKERKVKLVYLAKRGTKVGRDLRERLDLMAHR